MLSIESDIFPITVHLLLICRPAKCSCDVIEIYIIIIIIV